MTRLEWTELPNKYGTVIHRRAGTWPDLIQRLRAPDRYASKDDCPWVKLAKLGDTRSDRGSYRTNDNIVAVYGVEGDYDGGVVPMAEAIQRLEAHGIRAAVYPSANHMRLDPPKYNGGPRWRVMAPLSTPHTREQRAALLARVNGALGGILADESFAQSQSYYFGDVGTNDYKVVTTFDDPNGGQCVDELDELDDIAIGKPKAAPGAGSSGGAGVMAAKVAELGRLLRTGDGRRGLFISEIAGLAHRNTPPEQIRVMVAGLAALYCDHDDPIDEENIAAIVAHFEREVPYYDVDAEFDAIEIEIPVEDETTPTPDPAVASTPDPAVASTPVKATKWPTPADPFEEYIVPGFPVDALPDAFAVWCRELSAQSGFDVGGYAFAALVTAANLIDHRCRAKFGSMSVPPNLWGGLVAVSGGGKSPTLNAILGPARRINDETVKRSDALMQDYLRRLEAASKDDRKHIRRPPWLQLIASDTTVEALAKLLQDNPWGIFLAVDELTEWIGRMDAYSGNGAGKDRGKYLTAFDGGTVTVNRATAAPMVVENFSVGMLAGVQPEKWAELFKKSGGGSDGLYQRFLVYVMQPAGRVDYSATLDVFTEADAIDVFQRLHNWTAAGSYEKVRLCPEALPLMQEYHQAARDIAQRTPAKRFGEHLDKFPGFLGRVTLALHCIECAVRGELAPVIALDTFERARRIMQTLYRHSEAVYTVLDSQSGDVFRLTRSACEAILSKRWDKVQRGDLTRYATDWRDAEDRFSESAIDYLIEIGWLRDITPPVQSGRRGRRSSGVFKVNPAVHSCFATKAEHLTTTRAQRYEAIKKLAAQRADHATPE